MRISEPLRGVEIKEAGEPSSEGLRRGSGGEMEKGFLQAKRPGVWVISFELCDNCQVGGDSSW